MVVVVAPELKGDDMKRRTRQMIMALLALALTAGGGSVAQAEPFIPGYTDFPNALRVADEQQAKFIPGYTDFPNALRLAPAGTVRSVPIVVTNVSPSSGFDWADASIGAGVTAALLLSLGGLSVTLRRRGRVAAQS
jgi:hypothetical protein